MKKILLSLIFMLYFFDSFSQIPKGTVMLGGSFNLSGHTTRNIHDSSFVRDNSLGFKIRPYAGIFFRDNWVIGVSPLVGYLRNSRNDNDFRTHSNQFTYGMGVLVRRYFKLSDRWYLFAGAGIDGSKNKQSNSQNNSSFKSNNVSFSIHPGVSYFITSKLAIETSLNLFNINYNSYNNSDQLNIYENEALNYNFNLNLSSLNFGLVFYLKKKVE